jgi:C4-dicarboxylate-specific signal transduction histidine kinase
MRTLGDEMISSEVVALIELVKNAYDADATRVLIDFHPPLTRGEGGIDVIDDGHGMSLETALQVWLEPATQFRQRERQSEEFHRNVLGEKGIGRFAASRLAEELELVTRRPGAPVETRIVLDWRDFDREAAYLDEVTVLYEQSEPADIAPGGVAEALWRSEKTDRADRGTALRLRVLRTEWSEANLHDLRNDLARLVSPYLFEEQRSRADGFSIWLRVPEPHASLSGLVEPPEALRNPDYTLSAVMDADGHYSAEIHLKNGETISRTDEIVIGDRQPTCGQFRLELRVWDRDRESMAELADRSHQTAKEVREDLNRAAGINVYRDGFRVLPYGDPGDDWLTLDARRIQNPTMRISNNQVVGYVLISSENNPELRDQTNREGLLKNDAFADLTRALKELITALETERYRIRPREERPTPPSGGLFAALNIDSVRAYATETYPGDRQLASLLGEVQATLDEGVERAEEVVARYRRLATLGGLVDQVLHDGRAPLTKIATEAENAQLDLADDDPAALGKLREHLGVIQTQQRALGTVFRRIEPFSGRRRGRPRPRALEEILAESVAVKSGELERAHIDVSVPETRTTVTADESELQQVFVNLLDNSIHWVSRRRSGDRGIVIEVARDDDGVHVVFSDSGPGVPDEIRDRIFEPYFSTKPEGVGLGLSIAGEIVEDYYGGSLELLDGGPLPGATFRITLRRRIG